MSTRQAVSLALGVLVAGLVVLAIGLSMAGSRSDARIICDDQVMGTGDVCISNRPSNSGTYEELLREERKSAESAAANGPVVAGVGGVIAAGGALVLLAQVPRRIANRNQPPASSDWWTEEDRS
jgi:hypothetical protein